MGKLVRKNIFLEPGELKKAQRILREKNESEAVRRAIRLVAFSDEVRRGYDRIAGKAPDFGDPWGDD